MKIIPYTIAFIIYNDQILLMKRYKEPWIKQWNGIGGKIIDTETPVACVQREVLEETGIYIPDNLFLYKGLVLWPSNGNPLDQGGMYTFVALQEKNAPQLKRHKTPEGFVAWKPLSWAIDKKNKEIATNIPYFLPDMLKAKKPQEYTCTFQGNKITKYTVSDLT